MVFLFSNDAQSLLETLQNHPNLEVTLQDSAGKKECIFVNILAIQLHPLSHRRVASSEFLQLIQNRMSQNRIQGQRSFGIGLKL